MASRIILNLRWDDQGEALINFEGLDLLHGIEKADFLDDVIGLLEERREQLGADWAQDYL